MVRQSPLAATAKLSSVPRNGRSLSAVSMAVGWSYDAAAEIHSAENTDQLI